MRSKTAAITAFSITLFIVLAQIAVGVGIGFVAIHFIKKLW